MGAFRHIWHMTVSNTLNYKDAEIWYIGQLQGYKRNNSHIINQNGIFYSISSLRKSSSSISTFCARLCPVYHWLRTVVKVFQQRRPNDRKANRKIWTITKNIKRFQNHFVDNPFCSKPNRHFGERFSGRLVSLIFADQLRVLKIYGFSNDGL